MGATNQPSRVGPAATHAHMQDTLKALHLQDVPPWQIAGGTAAAALVAYSLYRERKGLRRAAAELVGGMATGLSQIAGMATGFQPNAMVAVPRPHG